MNGKRPNLLKVLKDQSVQVILIEHRYRLTRFGFEFLDTTLAAQGRSVIVAEAKEPDDVLVNVGCCRFQRHFVKVVDETGDCK